MDFDWNQSPFERDGSLKEREIEESFEDPFAVRLLPDSARFAVQARYFNLGRSALGQGVFSVYRTNGRVVRVIAARLFTEEENFFYLRKVNEALMR
jgi:uncharacterized DUF497 family protein